MLLSLNYLSELEVMMLSQDLNFLKDRLLQRSAALLLGAGFSLGAKNQGGNDLPLGKGLANKLYKHFYVECPPTKDAAYIKNVSNYQDDLRKMCTILRSENRQEIRDTYLSKIFSGCRPSAKQFQHKVKKYNWDTIFTLNIDDLVENIFSAANTPLCVWNKGQNGTRKPNTQTLIKLHGDVNYPEGGFVFDDDEYSKFASDNDCLLKEFAHVFVTRDMVILGSEFQESDISFVRTLYESAGYENNGCHYFFVVPQINDLILKNKIESIDNFHWIEMDTERFLTFISQEVIQVTNNRNLLKECGAVFIDEVPIKEDYTSEIYYGKPAQYNDFFGQWDIIYPNQKVLIKKAAECRTPVTIITLFGKSYSGKTTVAKRCLVDLRDSGYITLEIPHMEYTVYQSLAQYLLILPAQAKVAILMENTAYQYEHIAAFANEHFNDVAHLVVITTDTAQNHKGRSHNLLNLPEQIEWYDLEVSEKVTPEYASKIFYGLCVKKRLNNYLKLCPAKTHPTDTDNMCRIWREMQKANDIIDVLYFNSEGKYFRQYYVDWVRNHRSDFYDDYLYVLAGFGKLGISAIPLHIFPKLVPSKTSNFNAKKFLICYPDIVEAKGGYVKLLRSRLIGETLHHRLDDTIKNALYQLVRYTIGLFSEGDGSEAYEMFQKALRVKRIYRHSLLSSTQTASLFASLEKHCSRISYFWIQYGVAFQLVGKFSDANNHFLYAKNIRPGSYQVAHALAKNRMEIGLDDWKNRRPYADENFQQGCVEMEEIINNPNYSRAFIYSVHAYSNMLMKYYRERKQIIPPEKCEKINYFFKDLLEMEIDSGVKEAIIQFCYYCKDNNMPQYCKGLENVWRIRPRIVVDEDYIDIEE